MKKSEYEKHIRNNIARSTELQRFSLKLCTFKEFKTNLMKESSNFGEKNNGLNDTCFSDNFQNANSIEYPNCFNSESNFYSDYNNQGQVESHAVYQLQKPPHFPFDDKQTLCAHMP